MRKKEMDRMRRMGKYYIEDNRRNMTPLVLAYFTQSCSRSVLKGFGKSFSGSGDV